jgi:hypothetical protein
MALRRKTSLQRVIDAEFEGADKGPTDSSPQKSRSATLQLTKPATPPSQPASEIIDPAIEKFLDMSSLPLAPAPASENALGETTARVEKAMDNLGELESAVIGALFPTDGSPPASFDEVGRKLGLTLEEVRELADNGLRSLRSTTARPPRISTVWN